MTNKFTQKLAASEVNDVLNGVGPVATFESLHTGAEVHIARDDNGYVVVPVPGLPDMPAQDTVDVVCFPGGLTRENWLRATRKAAKIAWYND